MWRYVILLNGKAAAHSAYRFETERDAQRAGALVLSTKRVPPGAMLVLQNRDEDDQCLSCGEHAECDDSRAAGVELRPGQTWQTKYWEDGKGQAVRCAICKGTGRVPR